MKLKLTFCECPDCGTQNEVIIDTDNPNETIYCDTCAEHLVTISDNLKKPEPEGPQLIYKYRDEEGEDIECPDCGVLFRISFKHRIEGIMEDEDKTFDEAAEEFLKNNNSVRCYFCTRHAADFSIKNF